ncbi:Pyridine nucleotide-disulfide oxidoreductase; NADH dehydrogenase (EC [Olavius sp. associated proteobacterium Delta 1]|nr:Pyridine nucleotide-disulfide oxidoreductase; NADH dehydrogenase (EC [Olavius sp. associated proteobacterium Delta 1]
MVVRQAQVFRDKQDINLLTGHCAEKIDPDRQTVSGMTLAGDRFEFPYDKLLIATGGAAIKPDLAGFDLPGVVVLKNLADGRKIKKLLKSKGIKKAVIIGMGYIALEMCESLVGLNIAVDMVKPNPVFLPWLEPSMAQVIQTELEAKGVGVYAGHAVELIDKTADGLQVKCRGLTLAADMVLVGIGITPCSRIAENAGLELSTNNSIAVDRKLRTSDKNIYAAGDCADAFHMVTGQKTWIPLALRANRAGWAVADNVIGKHASLDGVVGTSVFRVFDYEVARTGLSLAEARKAGFEAVENSIQSSSRAHSYGVGHPIWVNLIGDNKSGRLLGAQIVGKEGAAHRINGPAVALHNRMTVAQYSQTDLAYAPPFGPTWDPTLTAANQLLKKL